MNNINDYVRNNMIPGITANQQAVRTNGIPSQSMDFQQLLLQKMQTAFSMNSNLQNGNDDFFSTSFLSNMMGKMMSPNAFNGQQNGANLNGMGNYFGQAMSQYQAANQWDQVNPSLANTTGTTNSGVHKQAPTDEFNPLITQAAQKYNVDENLIHAIIKMESNYNPSSKSNAGAVGLMQLMPSTAKDVGVTDRHNNAQNIDGGTHYFSKMLQRHNGNVELALASYNAGPGNVQKYGGIPPFKETQNYIKKVMDYYAKT